MSLTTGSPHNKTISSLHAASTVVGSSRLLLSAVPGLPLARLVPVLLVALVGTGLESGEVARSRVVFQPLLARTQISREERSGSKFSGRSLRVKVASMVSSGERRMRIRRWSSVSVVPGKRTEEDERDPADDDVSGFSCGAVSISSCKTSSSFLIELSSIDSKVYDK